MSPSPASGTVASTLSIFARATSSAHLGEERGLHVRAALASMALAARAASASIASSWLHRAARQRGGGQRCGGRREVARGRERAARGPAKSLRVVFTARASFTHCDATVDAANSPRPPFAAAQIAAMKLSTFLVSVSLIAALILFRAGMHVSREDAEIHSRPRRSSLLMGTPPATATSTRCSPERASGRCRRWSRRRRRPCRKCCGCSTRRRRPRRRGRRRRCGTPGRA